MNHLERWEQLCPTEKLQNDREWAPVAFMFAANDELWRKAASHMRSKTRDINWSKILEEDFGSGHRAAIYWAFSLWAGNSWRVYDENDRLVKTIDTMDEAYSMNEALRRIALDALAWRWLNKRPFEFSR